MTNQTLPRYGTPEASRAAAYERGYRDRKILGTTPAGVVTRGNAKVKLVNARCTYTDRNDETREINFAGISIEDLARWMDTGSAQPIVEEPSDPFLGL